MKIGIISDTHDHVWNYEKVIAKLKEQNIGALIHCGDICAPIITKRLTELKFPVHCVSGNTNDEYTTLKLCSNSENTTHHGNIAELELDRLKIAVVHYPILAEALAHTQKYDFVFHGHTHIKEDKIVGNTRIINPGEILGLNGKPSFVVLDSQTKKVEFFELEEE